ncbi:MAG: curlin [Thermodesulfobacteriaceae bacterium]|nr:curlin [Thermodesulfobacteriaceae bacterium]MDW8136633.1 CsgG/HfaB family protein [Thermodesulfobacterium sp.]
MKSKIRYGGIFLALALALGGCAGPVYSPFYEKAMSGTEYITSVHKDLISLPPPEKQVPVAVYKFRDQTGQYKPPTTSTNFSTAVTQGATAILIKALEDSGWFIPVERENLANLLQERKIILQMGQQYADEKLKEATSKILQPLIYAGVILEGGVIGYDTNIVSGGFGAKYFGAGGAAQYRVDRVTVYLRAVSVKNGAILKTVQATKVILSQQLSAGFFRFVRLNRLLEIEAGIASNEPVEMAVQEAIEKAVHDLIIEGVKIGMWKPKEPEVFKAVVEKYERERKEALKRLKQMGESSFWGEVS